MTTAPASSSQADSQPLPAHRIQAQFPSAPSQSWQGCSTRGLHQHVRPSRMCSMFLRSPPPPPLPTVPTMSVLSKCFSQDARVPCGVLGQYQRPPAHGAPWSIGVPTKTAAPSHRCLSCHARIHKRCHILPKLLKMSMLYRHQVLPVIDME